MDSSRLPGPHRLAVHAPEYWPRQEVAALALLAHEIVLADTFQYSRQSFHNRARIRTPQGWHWLSVPLKGGQHGRPIYDVEIDGRTDWRGKHLRSIAFNYRTSPYFDYYGSSVGQLLHQPWSRLGPLTVATFEWVLQAFRIEKPVRVASRDADARLLVEKAHSGSRNVVLVVDAERSAHDAAFGTRMCVVSYRESPRRQNFAGFEREMTALDLLFNYGPEARAVLERDVRASAAST